MFSYIDQSVMQAMGIKDIPKKIPQPPQML